MDETLKDLSKLFVDKMIKEWMFEHVKGVSKLSNVVKCKRKNEKIISYVDFSKICHAIKCFPDLNFFRK